MEAVAYSDLNKEEKKIVKEAFKAAEHSVSKSGHKVGCAILCEGGKTFVGATNERSRAIGSSCAERIAVDQFYFHNYRKPKSCALVGTFNRFGWSENFLCTPCGVCLEMFQELIIDLDLKDLDFLCLSWDKSKIFRIKLSELYPQIGKGKWRRI